MNEVYVLQEGYAYASGSG